jgi:hypothetical protein
MELPHVAVQDGILSSLFFTCTLLLLCSCPSDATPAACFIFGDSLVDIGNNNHLPLSLAKHCNWAVQQWSLCS